MLDPGRRCGRPARRVRAPEYSDIGGPGGIAERNTYIGPDLDPGSATAAHAAGGYHDRWTKERAGHLVPTSHRLTGWMSESSSRYDVDHPREPSTADRLGLPPSNLIPFRSQGGVRAKLRVVPGDQQDTDANTANMPPVLSAVHKVFKATGADRLHTTRLLADPALDGLSAKRLGTLLAACGVQPESQPFIQAGQRGRGYRYADVAAAIQRIVDGRLKPADHSRGWSGPTDEVNEED